MFFFVQIIQAAEIQWINVDVGVLRRLPQSDAPADYFLERNKPIEVLERSLDGHYFLVTTTVGWRGWIVGSELTNQAPSVEIPLPDGSEPKKKDGFPWELVIAGIVAVVVIAGRVLFWKRAI